jgi:hypothetical protein
MRGLQLFQRTALLRGALPPNCLHQLLGEGCFCAGRDPLIYTSGTPNGEMTMSRTANDDRSDSMNPNNDAYDDAMDNHSNQLNPNNDAYEGNGDSEED